MPKFVVANDIHLSARSPISRTDDYTAAILGKLDQLLLLAIKTKASAILLAGDIFHHKEWSRVPTYLIYQLLLWCKQVQEAGIRVIAIPGNHDLQNDRYESIPSQPIGLLFGFGAIEDASFRSIEVDGVAVVGIPYPSAKDLNNWNTLPHPSQKSSIVMGHCFATMEGGEYFGEPVLQYSDLLHLPFNAFIFGHDHRDNGVAVLNGRPFINVGAISRGASSKENIVRDVKCALLEITQDSLAKVTQIKLNFRPANEVFDFALRAQKDRERAQIESFVGSLNQDLLNIAPISFKDRLEALDVSEEVRARVMLFIDKAEEELAI